jgi:putative RNA 2'-phosphotransferase
MTPQQKIKQFGKFLSYVLERHPEEFGLIPNESGYVKTKELLKALNETDGWRHIRDSSLNELLLVDDAPPIELSGDLVRGKERQHLPRMRQCQDVPKILYTCIRERAYANVLEKGILPAGHTHVICTPDSAMAERLGYRKDKDAIRLTIHTAKTSQKEINFYQFTDLFYLAEHIPPDTFTGPPITRQVEKENTGPAKAPKAHDNYGTFIITPEMMDPSTHKSTKGKKKKLDWKQDRKHRRKKDKSPWPDGF